MRRIRISIGNGKMIIDFDGFIGDTCFTEHEKLRQHLEKMGIRYEHRIDKLKSEAYVEQEQKHEVADSY